MDSLSETERARSLEERLINVWPALTTVMIEGWAVRFANGYSGRANSASALAPGAKVTAATLARIEQLYRDAKLQPQFRISPVAAEGTEAVLLAQGYRVKDEAVSMTVALNGQYISDPRVAMASEPQQPWLDGISVRQEPSKRSPDHLRAIVSRVTLPAAFATLRVNGAATAFAYSAIDRAYAEIGLVMVDGAERGKGLGRAVVTSLMHWAKAKSASHAFLQVDTNNRAALKLYESLGFRRAYQYRTLVKD